jgi:hypothetical protein
VKKRFLGLFLVLVVMTGCSEKNEIAEMFTPDRIYEKALVYTREDQVVRELETMAAISATLLNEVFPDKYRYDDGVYFFVGIVTQLDVEEFKKNYHITMNGEKPLSIEKVDERSDLYKLMPNVNRWGKYFVVKFPPTPAKKLVIDFGIYPYGKVLLTFQRPSKRR